MLYRVVSALLAVMCYIYSEEQYMGTYVNPGFDNFNSSRKNKFYVDKSMLIALLNG